MDSKRNSNNSDREEFRKDLMRLVQKGLIKLEANEKWEKNSDAAFSYFDFTKGDTWIPFYTLQLSVLLSEKEQNELIQFKKKWSIEQTKITPFFMFKDGENVYESNIWNITNENILRKILQFDPIEAKILVGNKRKEEKRKEQLSMFFEKLKNDVNNPSFDNLADYGIFNKLAKVTKKKAPSHIKKLRDALENYKKQDPEELFKKIGDILLKDSKTQNNDLKIFYRNVCEELEKLNEKLQIYPKSVLKQERNSFDPSLFAATQTIQNSPTLNRLDLNTVVTEKDDNNKGFKNES